MVLTKEFEYIYYDMYTMNFFLPPNSYFQSPNKRRRKDKFSTYASEVTYLFEGSGWSIAMDVGREDLGMVPDCVPGVMQDLGFLTLEIQRMSKNPKL